jgi:hypothetical protein
MSEPARKVVDPHREGDVHYVVVGSDSTRPDILEVPKGTPGSFKTLQDAKMHAMAELRSRIEEATQSLSRIRQVGIDIPRLM